MLRSLEGTKCNLDWEERAPLSTRLPFAGTLPLCPLSNNHHHGATIGCLSLSLSPLAFSPCHAPYSALLACELTSPL